jgi:Xaa-Pro aminopeptidase
VTAEQVRLDTEREWSLKATKLRTTLQPLMRKHGVDMWIILSRENGPDPALELFGGNGITGWYGHRNAYVFYDPGGDRKLESVAIGTHLSGHLKAFYGSIVPFREEGLKPHLQQWVFPRDPKKIAIDESFSISMAAGLTASLKAYLVDALGAKYTKRLTSVEPLLVEYVSTHIDGETEVEREASVATYDILKRAFSNEVIIPGKTRLMDVYYWITAERKKQGFEFIFPASLDIQRAGGVRLEDEENAVIQPGDVLHVDFGVRLSGVVTDQQKMAYVLKPDETAPPPGLLKAFENSARMSDIIVEEMNPGRTGIEIRQAADKRLRAEGIEGDVYSHVQGYWVHDAGVWTNQDWPERYGAHPRTKLLGGEWMSLEFSTTTVVPEWSGQKVRMLREEDLWIKKDGSSEFLSGPQKELWVIRSTPVP